MGVSTDKVEKMIIANKWQFEVTSGPAVENYTNKITEMLQENELLYLEKEDETRQMSTFLALLIKEIGRSPASCSGVNPA
jgi:hypothetical protein